MSVALDIRTPSASSSIPTTTEPAPQDQATTQKTACCAPCRLPQSRNAHLYWKGAATVLLGGLAGVNRYLYDRALADYFPSMSTADYDRMMTRSGVPLAIMCASAASSGLIGLWFLKGIYERCTSNYNVVGNGG